MSKSVKSASPPALTARDLPSVEEVLSHQALRKTLSIAPRPVVAEVVREELSAVRVSLRSKKGSVLTTKSAVIAHIAKVLTHLERQSPQRVVNCTGILAHTNLGRAPLGGALLDEIRPYITGYSAVEFDLQSGERGSRGGLIERELAVLCGAEAGLVVNNCAAAMALIVNTLSKKKETIVSRGELVQIGGGFRVPDILRSAGGILREVGTTNITNARDYREAISSKSGIILKVHQSNFTQIGFSEQVEIAALSEIARKNALPLVYDLGSGLVLSPKDAGLAEEESGAMAIRRGANLVCFSGDKLLGSVQAGCIVGAFELIEKLRKNPLYRAFRVDKFTLAALFVTLKKYLNGEWREGIPLWRLAQAPEAELYRRGRRIIDSIGAEDRLIVEATSALFGGGALPAKKIPSCAIAFTAHYPPRELATYFREWETPVIGRVEDKRFLLDLRAVLPEDEGVLVEAMRGAMKHFLDS